MRNSLHERTADFLSKAEGAGLLAEIESKIENQHIERRKLLIARLKEIPSTRTKELKPFEGIGEKLASEVDGLAKALAAAKAKQMEYIQRTSTCAADREEIEIRKELAKTVPEFVRDAWLRLDFLYEMLVSKVDYGVTNEKNLLGGWTTIHYNNVEEITALRAQIQAAKDAVEALFYSEFDIEKMRAECTRLVSECRAASLRFADHPRDLRPAWDTNNE